MTMSPTVAYQALLSDRSYDIEFNGYLSNHAKHAIIALQKLEAPPSRLTEYWDEYTALTPYGLSLHPVTQPWEDVEPCSAEDWVSLRGRKERWPSMCKFLEKELADKFDGDVEELVASYAPDLLPGLAGALTHGIIHTGWALDAGNPWMTVEGLAYMNFCHLSVKPEDFVHEAIKEASPMDSLKRIAFSWKSDNLSEEWIAKAKARYDKTSGFHEELIPAGFQWELSKVLVQQHEVAFALPTWLDGLGMETLLEELYRVTVLLYLATRDEDGHGNFLVLHLITSLWGLEQVLKRVNDPATSRSAMKCFYAVMICLLSTPAGGFPSVETLETAATTYGWDNKDEAPAEVEAQEWPALVGKAILETEEHNIKLVYVARELWRRYGHWTGFRVAAETFTLTPNIGPSATSFKP